MRKLISIFCLAMVGQMFGQGASENVELSKFQLTNSASPAALLLEETTTSVYAVQNLKEFMVHSVNSFGQNLSFEITPYKLFPKFMIKDRTYYKYRGLKSENYKTDKSQQNFFSGLYRNLTFSVAYADKKFEGYESEKKSISLGARSTLFKIYKKNDVKQIFDAGNKMQNFLSNMMPPVEFLGKDEESKRKLKKFYEEEKSKDEYKNIKKEFTKEIKPLFQLDGSIAYATLLNESKKRLGTWLVSEMSLPLHKDQSDYLNLLVTARYIEDDFALNALGDFHNQVFRDFGGKLEVEFSTIVLSYEYLNREGSVSDNKSIGSVEWRITKKISLSGGFGKDFKSNNSRAFLFGVNWGLNFNGKPVLLPF